MSEQTFIIVGTSLAGAMAAEDLSERELAAQHSPSSVELRALLNDRLSLALNYVSAALVLGILVLMVFKP
jgi:hypothetical protein